jgi:hypothetical protein
MPTRPPRRRRWVIAGLVLGLATVLIGASVATAAADPTPPAPVPTGPPVDSCPTASPLPACAVPPATVTPTLPGIPTAPTTTTSPCAGLACLPTPTSTPPASTIPTTGGGTDSCGIGGWLSDVGDCAAKAINGWFAGIVTSALHPLLDLLGSTLLSTPPLESLPQVGPLWANSWQVVLAGYAVFVIVGGIVVMAGQGVRAQHGLKEILPRLLVAFVASASSLWVADQAIVLANALSRAVLGQDLDPSQATGALSNMLLAESLGGNVFLLLLGLGAVVLLGGLLVSYVVRAVVTLILVAAAPLCLACHALPHTEGISRWWAKSFAAVLAIQIAQALTLVVAIRVFLAPTQPGGSAGNLFTGSGGLLDVLVCLALLYILYRIPSWILAFVRVGGGRSLVGSLVKGYLMAKTFGALTGRTGPPRLPAQQRARRTWRPPPDPAWPAKIHAWYGVNGPRSPEAMEQRMRARQDSERAHRKPPSAVAPVRFQQASAQTPTHDLATGHATTAPAKTTFLTPARPRPSTPLPRPSTPPVPMTFRSPSTPPAALPPLRAASVPAELRFTPPTPLPEVPRPVHATTTPASPAFTNPSPRPVQRRARTHTPAPAQFRSAEPPPATSAPPPHPAPTPARFRAPRRTTAQPGGDK